MSARSSRLSACIIAFNEADRIAQCIRSVSFCDEVIVVDSFSTDSTRSIAQSLGAVVITKEWLGYGAQKEFAIRSAANDWVLCIDADERVSEELQIEIQQYQRDHFSESVGYSMPRLTKYEGKWIRHGTWYPDRSVRLFNRSHGRWTQARVHEKVELTAKPKPLVNNLLHEGYRNHAEHVAKTEKYAQLMAEELAMKGVRVSTVDVYVRCVLAFLRSLVVRQGYLDGRRGWKLAWLTAWYTKRKYALLRAMRENK